MISQKTPTSTTPGDISILPPTSPGFPSPATYNCRAQQPCTKWQDRLIAYCKENHLSEPAFHDYSDRRGGRTAWKTLVVIKPIQCVWSRFSYDVAFIHNAREDAAECALQHLHGIHPHECDCGSSYFTTGRF